jgi:hypothetical protein
MNEPTPPHPSISDIDAAIETALRRRSMGIDNITGEVTEATRDEDQDADDERAEDLRELERRRREREDQPHYEVRATCAGCGTELIIQVPQPYCDDCK